MANPLILARTFKEAHAFAQDRLGLRIGYYRVVNSAGTLKAVRGVDLYLVPGWRNRPDRFTMASALKWTRLNTIDVEARPDFDAVEEPPAATGDDFTDLITGADSNTLETIGTINGTPVIEDPSIEGLEGRVVDVMPTIDTPGAGDAMPTVERPEGTPEPVEMPTIEAEKPKARRRTRCKTCDTLHYKDEACPTPEDA